MIANDEGPPPPRPDCPTPTKRAHVTRRSARDHAVDLKQRYRQKLRPYLCDCGSWHVGHLPAVVLRGEKTAGEIYHPQREAS